jgi:PAS domain S-box-containing protein
LVQAELTRAGFDYSPDAILVVDSGGVIRAANEQARMLTGRTQADLIDQPVETLVPAGLRDRHATHRSDYLLNPRRRLMGSNLELAILQRVGAAERPVAVDVNLAPASISIGVVVVATIRQRGASRWTDD